MGNYYTYGFLKNIDDGSILYNELHLYDKNGNTKFALHFVSNNQLIPYVVDIPIDILPINNEILKSETYILKEETDVSIYEYIEINQKKI